MWIVRLALRKPYTFVVLAIVILILGPLAILRTPTDIFPTIDIPVVSVIWNYAGLDPEEMSNRIVSITERSLTTTVNDIEHIESQSLRGVAVVKIFFQPTRTHRTGDRAGRPRCRRRSCASCRRARRRRWSSATARRACRSCSSALSGRSLSEQQLFDYGAQLHPHAPRHRPGRGRSRTRTAASSARSWSTSTPRRCRRAGCRRSTSSTRSAPQNLILPGGTSKIGALRVRRRRQRQPGDGRRAERPADQDGRRHARSTSATSRTCATARRRRPTSCASTASARRCSPSRRRATRRRSTVIAGVKQMLPFIKTTGCRPSCEITPLSDQSVFVRASIDGVLKEASIAAVPDRR